MDINEYQKDCLKTANLSPDIYPTLCNFSMGLSGESGEVLDYVKKIVFQMHEMDKEKLTEEMGDVLWYFVCLAHVADIKLDDIIIKNISKLKNRYPDGFDSDRSINRDDT